MCLVRFALANIRRRPERFVLSVLGIALAIACVTIVRTISSSFAITGADSVTDVSAAPNCGRCPRRACTSIPACRHSSPVAPRRPSSVPAGWRATRTLSGVTDDQRNDRSRCVAGTKSPAAKQVWAPPWPIGSAWRTGDRVVVGGQSLTVTIAGTGQSVTVPTEPRGFRGRRERVVDGARAARRGEAPRSRHRRSAPRWVCPPRRTRRWRPTRTAPG